MNASVEGADRRGLLPRYTLKDANTFLLADALGDVRGSDDGLFCDDTRMLSRFELTVAGRQPSLLGAAITQDNTLFTAHVTNRPLPSLGEQAIPQGVIHIERSRLLWDGVLYERLRLTNYSEQDARVPLQLTFAADFADIFEVQGHVRKKHGTLLPPEVHDASVRLAYQGLDDVLRVTHIRFSRVTQTICSSSAAFTLEIARRETADLLIEIGPTAAPPSPERFDEALAHSRVSMRGRLTDGASISTSGRLFNEWVDKSRADLALLTTVLPTGLYPYAGIPWFATPFGRDALITALQTLWFCPTLAAGVLRFLATTQALHACSFRDAEPGKILHEMRRGELAALREVPFGQYYGSVDATPLFLMLAGAYEQRTGDRSLNDAIWEHLLAAILWIEQRLDRSHTGFLDYSRGEGGGLVNQAWKDSNDSVFHADGRIPRAPLAVVEVQGYACAALQAMSELAAVRGDTTRSQAWRERAVRLRTEIERKFWIPEMRFYALAIDAEGEPCKVHASNPGHLLYCGVPSEEHGVLVAEELLSRRFFSGWGIRTLAEGQPRYNPMSYHDGSVWPHDTALCAAGIARYSRSDRILGILNGVFEAANHFGMRLPELYCGFPRVLGQGPTPYPVACLPQAWSAGSVFMLLQACLGLTIDGRRQEVHIQRPLLPGEVESLRLGALRVGDTSIDLDFHRIANEVVAVPSHHDEGGIRVFAHL
jgi:glycogen debranching enzyme